MNPYQSPVPIEEESHPWLRFLLFAAREAFMATLSFVVLLAASLLLLAVMPIAIGLAWYQFRRSSSLLDLGIATIMTSMFPFWENGLAEALVIILQCKS